MDKGKRKLMSTKENLRLDEMIKHRDFLLQLVEEQNKRIRSMRLKQSLKDMVDTPGVMEALTKQNLQDNKRDAI